MADSDMYQADFAAGEQPDMPTSATPPKISEPSAKIAGWLGLALTLVLLGGVVYQATGLDLSKFAALLPRNPSFWTIFAIFYMIGPVSDWIIFKKLWNIPLAGLGALLRKQVSNELLLGYLGEVQFYSWARQRTEMTTAPFGAVKDVAILSALVGNGVTLPMLALAAPLLGTTQIGMDARTAFLSLSVVLGTSILILFFRQRLFSLPKSQLWMVTGIHLARTVVFLGLSGLMWHLTLPEVPLGWWLILATLRMLVSRLPLVPNKDVVFAGLAVFLLGHDVQIGALMTMMAGITLVAHIVVGATLGGYEIIQRWRMK